MDDVTWAALTVTLTVGGALYSWWAFRHRGVAPGLRGLAFTGLPAAAWLTGTSQMFAQIATSVARWATDLVLSPTVWAGFGICGLSALLYVASRMVDTRRAPPRGNTVSTHLDPPTSGRPVGPISNTGSNPSPRPPATDDDFAEIEALLRRKGIE